MQNSLIKPSLKPHSKRRLPPHRFLSEEKRQKLILLGFLRSLNRDALLVLDEDGVEKLERGGGVEGDGGCGSGEVEAGRRGG